MSKRYNKQFALIVLISFLALLTPKSLWHDCSHGISHTKHTHSDSKHQFSQGVEKCYACDLHIPLLSHPTDRLALNLTKPFVANHSGTTASAYGTAIAYASLRGPPAYL